MTIIDLGAFSVFSGSVSPHIHQLTKGLVCVVTIERLTTVHWKLQALFNKY